MGDETIPAAAGAFRGSLGLLLARQGQLDEAQVLFRAGEPQVRSVPSEYAKFLCKKGHLCHMAGNRDGAMAALTQAREIATELKVTEESVVGRALVALSEALDANES